MTETLEKLRKEVVNGQGLCSVRCFVGLTRHQAQLGSALSGECDRPARARKRIKIEAKIGRQSKHGYREIY